MYKVLISGFYGFDNAGDEAILQSIVSQICNVSRDIDIVVLSACPEKTSSEFKIKSVNRFNFLRIISAIRNCDILISGGGSLFQDRTSISSFWYYSAIILLAFILKKPVFAYAHGIGPIRSRFNKKLLRFVMNRVAKLSVRDQRSKTELQNIGVSREITTTIDPAFLIEPVSREESVKLLEKEMGQSIEGRRRIGFSIRLWEEEGHVDVAGIFAKVCDRVKKELDADVLLIPLHNKEDVTLAENIASLMTEKATIIKEKYTPAQIIGMYGLLDVSVCIRFHGLVFSIMNGTPVVAISYDPKIDSLMDSLGMNKVIRYGQINEDIIYNAIQEEFSRREQISPVIMKKYHEFRELAQKGMNEVISYMKGS
jgi:polysaccharide pyruvyl transferase CsaB